MGEDQAQSPRRRESDGVVTKARTQWGALSLILIGVLILGIEVALHLYSVLLRFQCPEGHTCALYEPSHWFIALGAAFVFTGFFVFNPKQAEEGGGFLSNVVLNVISVVRTGKTAGIVFERRSGRRSTDPIVVGKIEVKTEPAPAAPEEPPAPGGSNGT